MYDFKKVEEQSENVWKKHEKEIKKAMQYDSQKPLFSFLEGPPTANAPPALHHMEARTFKDIICKFKYMQGFSVPRKAGWDCHGLPVEVQIEKQLGLKNKKDILSYGIGKFNQKAKESVWEYIKEWNWFTKKISYWVDLENPYVTLDSEYVESVWWSLKELYKKKLLYEGHKVVPYCPRCQTPLSSHEVALGYKDIEEDSVYVAFRLKNKKDEYVLAWTTTPWTLPGNVALAVGKNIDYVKVKLPGGDKIIIGKEKKDLVKDGKIIEKLKGKDLVGLEYEPLYDIKELQNENSHKIIPADFVSTEEGTGIVHTAVMYGEDDYNLGIKYNLPRIHTVGEDGKFLDIVPKFVGKFVKSAEKEIIDDLKSRNLLFKKEKITHSYPFCWRCSTPLLYYAINSWFIKVSKFRNELVKFNRKIKWVPEHIKEGRFGNWIEGAKDWALSRFKFWGTPLPVWKCSCGNEEIIGSIEELKKKSVKKFSEKEMDLHKPWIDKIKLKCSRCKKEMARVPDVIDCWYDSGSASFAQFHYPFENKKLFEKHFPYSYISEAIDQTRGWFYTLHVLGVLLFNSNAYKSVICAGHVVDEKGEKMSKSKGNIINPKEMIEKAGVDAIRLQFFTTSPGDSKRFSFNLMKDSVIPFLTILYNCNNYYRQQENKKLKIQIEDKWILSRLNSTIKEVTEKLDDYALDKAFLELQNFIINDFSRNYIKFTRDREDNKKIVGEVLEKISLILAPFAPYITEHIYQEFSKNSVHLSKWPKVEKKKIDKKLEKYFSITLMDVISTGLMIRDEKKINVRWPLKKIIISTPDKEFAKSLGYFGEVIKSQLNVKEVEIKIGGSHILVNLDTQITPELEAEGYARELSRQIQEFRKKLGLVKENTIKLLIITDNETKQMLRKFENFIKKRTNSREIRFLTDDKLIGEEKFKNSNDFKVKDKRGKIVINR
ncbi:MAG: isoleucine--tRNA ligase [archaeon]